MRLKFKNVREAYAALLQHEANVSAFYDDPMTEAMGAPTGDFQEGFDRRVRKIAGYIITHSKKGSRRYEAAFSRLESFMP